MQTFFSTNQNEKKIHELENITTGLLVCEKISSILLNILHLKQKCLSKNEIKVSNFE